MEYRREIDGLRAIAVLSVVLYHAGVPGLTGGYIGVDVFFVISGFLITGIIAGDLQRGTFSLTRFYEKRARRILPALVFVLGAASVLAWVVLTPAALQAFGDSVAATMVFGANIYFWQNLGYFTTAADFRLLLHTWSLAVEEQFYVLWPLLLMFLVRFNHRLLLPVAVICFLASLALCVELTESYRRESFYLAPFRAWELLAGALVYFATGRIVLSDAARSLGAYLGLALVVAPVFAYDAATVFPGAAAIPPVVGAALLILCRPEGIVGRFLRARPMVFFGLISYSLYLWHWPILAGMRVVQGSIELAPFAKAAAVMFSVAAAWFSWRFVERPFRDRERFGVAEIWRWSVVSIAFMAGSGLLLSVSGGAPNRLNDIQATYISAETADSNPFIACNNRFPSSGLCRLGSADVVPSVLLWGDSHASSLAPALDALLVDRNVAGLLAGHNACAPLIGVHRSRGGQPSCRRFVEAMADYLESADTIDTVVLVGRWPLNALGSRAPGEPGGEVRLARDDGEGEHESNAIVFRYGLERTVAMLRDLNKRVVIVGGVPEIGWDVPSALFASSRLGIDPPAAPTAAAAQARHAVPSAIGQEIAHARGAEWVALVPLLCPAWCAVDVAGVPAYVDDDHLSSTGSVALIRPVLDAVFPPALAPRPSVGGS